MSDTQDDRDKVIELVERAQSAMLTTVTPDGGLVSRPMAVQEAEFDGDLWFFAQRDSDQVRQLQANPAIGVALAASDSWVSVSGTAELVEDRAKARELWNSAVEAWFPNGPDDPDVLLVKVHAEQAEYWDSPGSKVTTVLTYAKSKLTGDRPDVGEHGRLDLPN